MKSVTTVVPHARYTLPEYLRLEEYANIKHEYLDGQIYAMAGGTPEHGALAMRIGAALVEQLRGRPCAVFSSDVRIRVTATGLDTYPDLSVVCGDQQRDHEDPNALVNPVVLVEVLSPGTEEYDRGEKLQHYKQITSLQEVVLATVGEPHIDVFRREGEDWKLHAFRGEQVVKLTSIGCELQLTALYDGSKAG